MPASAKSLKSLKPASVKPPSAKSKGATAPAKPKPAAAASLAQKLAGIGLREDWDFALHLPMRYEDETHITRVRDALAGVPCQVEAEIIHTDIAYRPRRQLVVQAKDGDELLYLRFLNFLRQSGQADGRRQATAPLR